MQIAEQLKTIPPDQWGTVLGELATTSTSEADALYGKLLPQLDELRDLRKALKDYDLIFALDVAIEAVEQLNSGADDIRFIVRKAEGLYLEPHIRKLPDCLLADALKYVGSLVTIRDVGIVARSLDRLEKDSAAYRWN